MHFNIMHDFMYMYAWSYNVSLIIMLALQVAIASNIMQMDFGLSLGLFLIYGVSFQLLLYDFQWKSTNEVVCYF